MRIVGTGAHYGILATCIEWLQLVDGTGRVLSCAHSDDPSGVMLPEGRALSQRDLLHASAVSLVRLAYYIRALQTGSDAALSLSCMLATGCSWCCHSCQSQMPTCVSSARATVLEHHDAGAANSVLVGDSIRSHSTVVVPPHRPGYYQYSNYMLHVSYT